jgi:hypothetical protein
MEVRNNTNSVWSPDYAKLPDDRERGRSYLRPLFGGDQEGGRVMELKPCPFCGGPAGCDSGDGEPAASAWCHRADENLCDNISVYSIGAWNNRPIEDALSAEIADLKAKLAVIRDVWIGAFYNDRFDRIEIDGTEAHDVNEALGLA